MSAPIDSLDEIDTSILDELGDTFSLLMDANNGYLSPEAQTHEFRFIGDTRSEALGKAYVIRDAIRDAGRTCEATYDEEADDVEWMDDDTLHWVTVRIAEADS